MRQLKCPLASFKWRAGSPLFDFVCLFVFFSWGGSQCEGGIDPDAGISPSANRMGKHAFQTHFDGKKYTNENIYNLFVTILQRILFYFIFGSSGIKGSFRLIPMHPFDHRLHVVEPVLLQ